MTVAYEHNGQPVTSAQFYAVACDPQRSVAVEACAGAGKTWMLVSRMLRALLEDEACQPHEILAITFTKKAAGEMRARLQAWLAEFAHATPEQLEHALLIRGMRPEASKNKRDALQNLYQSLLKNGRGVQIRTFHGWFAALLRTAPLSLLQDLQLPLNYQLLEDDTLAYPAVWRRFFATLLKNATEKQDFQDLVAEFGRSQTLKALEEALSKRVEFVLADRHGAVQAAVPHFATFYPEFAGFGTVQAVLQTSDMHRRILLDAAKVLGAAPQKTFSAKGSELEMAVTRQGLNTVGLDAVGLNAVNLNSVLAALLTDKGARRKFNAALANNDFVAKAQDLAVRLQAAQAQHAAWQHQQRMTRLTRLLIAEFTALKQERGWVDMNDVERAAQHMLTNVEMSGWVQERLDARVKHLLIDEFQDTSPLQWQTLYAWLSGYAGAGGGVSGGAPSVFIVGDPKQSIYRFRRAEPQVFIAAQQFVQQGLGGDLLSCDHTRRNAVAVIAAVNTVMQTAQAAGEYQHFRHHSTAATTQGAVLCLPQIQRDAVEKGVESVNDSDLDSDIDNDYDTESSSAWRDSLTTPRDLAQEKHISLECRQATAFIAQELMSGKKASDIMVLARKRSRLTEMQQALQALGIASQQPEKSDLADAPEVQDVMALLDVLVSPTHDLSLARALKSPIFGLDDEALVGIAMLQREQTRQSGMRPSWLDVLTDLHDETPQKISNLQHILLQISEQTMVILYAMWPVLARWKTWLATLPPHDALNAIFHDGDLLAKFAVAAPATRRASVLANLQALLSAALDINAARYATPYGFVRALRSVSSRGGGSTTGNATMNTSINITVDVTQTVQSPVQNNSSAVQLLTIHGAKGLEADLVLLLDTDAVPARAATMSVLVDWPGEAAAPASFVFLASESRPAPSVVEALAVERLARQREELNALYVAMTRAKAQLVLSSVTPHREAGLTWWQRLQTIATHVRPEPVEGVTDTSTDALTHVSAEHTQAGASRTNANEAADFELLVLPSLPALHILASTNFKQNKPESLINKAYAAIDNVAYANIANSLQSRLGQAMHRLLQWLPTQDTPSHVACAAVFPAADIQAVAQEFALTPAQTEQAVAMAERIATGEGAWCWDSARLDWQGNEVELTYKGQLLRLDRLVRRKSNQPDMGEWWVLDYKSESQPERNSELVAQLQTYRAAVLDSQPSGSTVKMAFLTGAGRLVEVK